MNIADVINLLQNSGITVKGVDSNFIYFEDPACVYTAFDTILDFAWIVIVVLTAIMLFGWALLYIKNGTKINDIFNNAKTIILILCVLSAVKPIMNMIYGDNLFAKGCDIKKASLEHVEELINMRKKTDENSLYETFDIIDSGVIYDSEQNEDNQ